MHTKKRLSVFINVIITLTLVFGLRPGSGLAASGGPGKGELPGEGPDEVEIIQGFNLPEAMQRDFPGLAAPQGADPLREGEPNNLFTEATTLPGSNLVATGNIFPAADVDFYAFQGQAGERVYAAVQTSFSASASTDSVLTLLAGDGATVLESDDHDGSFGSLSSSIAGTVLPAAGTYYLKVQHVSATSLLRPYYLYLRLQGGLQDAEVEPNDAPATAQLLPPNGWVGGLLSAQTDVDFYSIFLNAGDTVYLSLDLDPERDAATWNGRLGIAVFGNSILVVNDTSVASPNSEAFFMTVKEAGTYYVYIDTQVAFSGAATYHLSASVHPAAAQGVNCTTYTSTDVPLAIPSGPGDVSSTLTIPGNPRIADLDVTINLTHTFMNDLDVLLVAPSGNVVGLFSDVGNATTGSPNTTMATILDDEAAIPINSFSVSEGWIAQPELNYRLSWFDGQDAGGMWKLQLYDDTTGDGGMLQNWSLTVCEPPPQPACAPGFTQVTLYSSDFESGASGFTSSGTLNEWELGSPSFAPIDTCNSGVNCWKTDLDNTYDVSSNQDLLSPAIDLNGVSGPILVTWAQKYSMESANFDHAFAEVRQAGGANPLRLWEWLDATMNTPMGNPTVAVVESAGWGLYQRDISAYAGQQIELRYHLDGDTTINLAGYAVDDVTVTGCVPSPALELIVTAGTDSSVCSFNTSLMVAFGANVTYCYTIKNTGGITLDTHTLTDSQFGSILSDFPYNLAPGASAFITATTPLYVTTVSLADWKGSESLYGLGFTTSDTITVTVAPPVFLPHLFRP